MEQRTKQNAEMNKKFSHLVVQKSSDVNNEIGDEQMESIMDNYQKIEEANRQDRENLNSAKATMIQMQDQLKSANIAYKKIVDSRDKLQQQNTLLKE